MPMIDDAFDSVSVLGWHRRHLVELHVYVRAESKGETQARFYRSLPLASAARAYRNVPQTNRKFPENKPDLIGLRVLSSMTNDTLEFLELMRSIRSYVRTSQPRRRARSLHE